MKLSKLMHVLSVFVGFTGVVTFSVSIIGNPELIFGITKMDALACTAILLLIAIWVQLATIHHMMLERKGEVI
jgi:hypothetical protein